ncbi:hypothetical protein [Aliikangiella sp. IMCC44359]|uniref:hypothetical protein n=1 Tax=Aliikangiella sp. IMCC44359 TaxID=3459125 RepID=UPI00403AE913
MNNISTLQKKASRCLSKKVDMPMSPVWHMGKISKFASKGDHKLMQDAIDYLTCKAQNKLSFNDDDKEFLVELYEAFWWGGKYKGYHEAAQLAKHYVHGNGASVKLNPEIYKNIPIVSATIQTMKTFIQEKQSKGIISFDMRCDNSEFRTKNYVKKLFLMNFKTEGKMKSNGVLEAPQKNERVQKMDSHFYLKSQNTKINKSQTRTIWSIESIYDFEPFEKADYYTIIPLENFPLHLPDGLSQYMETLGIAKSFVYGTSWIEIW